MSTHYNTRGKLEAPSCKKPNLRFAILYYKLNHLPSKQEVSYLHGSSLNFVTPTDETSTILFRDEGNADTRFLTPSQSSKSSV